MLQRCPVCRGKKEVMGAGMMFKKCEACLGVGYTEANVDSCPSASSEVEQKEDGKSRKKSNKKTK